jgi:hypothetical protein
MPESRYGMPAILLGCKVKFIVSLFVFMVVVSPISAQGKQPGQYLPLVSRGAGQWSTVCKQAGMPFTDAVVVEGRMYVSRQDGAIFRDCELWTVLRVLSSNERGLNSLATDGRRLWAGYVSYEGIVSVGEIDIAAATYRQISFFGLAGNQHNAGALLYQDGVLFFGVGDNTVALDAQRDGPRGKIQVIDPLTGGKAEFARGLRNPWQMSRIDGNTYIADPGESKYEEVNILRSGSNYGWPCWEGVERRVYECVLPDLASGELVLPAHTEPVLIYGREYGKCIVGVAKVAGKLAYADFTGVIRSFDGAELKRFAGRLISKMTYAGNDVAVLTFGAGASTVELLR